MGNFTLKTDELVYEPAEDSYLLGENLEISPGESILEIGTGSGIVAMYASKFTNKITVTDINYNAIELADENFKINGIDNIEILFGDLFEVVENRKFDVILFNTPYLPTEKDDILDDELNYAFDGGSDGRKIIDLFLNEVKNHLNTRGKVQLIQSSLSDINKTLDKLDSEGFVCEVAKKERFFFEEIVLINGYL